MHFFLRSSDDLEQLVGSDGSQTRLRFLTDLHTKFEGGVKPEIIFDFGGSIPLFCQQFENRPFPAALEAHNLSTPYYQAQFNNLFRQVHPAVVVLSITADLTQPLWRHKTDHYLLAPEPGWKKSWTAEQKDWLTGNFNNEGLLSAEQFQTSLFRLVQALRQDCDPAIIILNASTMDPQDEHDTYHGLEDTFSLRTHRFNLALLRASTELGISILDVDLLLAEAGGDQVFQPLHYAEAAKNLIRQELIRILDDLEPGEKSAETFKLEMPYIDLTTSEGTIHKWHKKPGELIRSGDKVFDLEIAFRKLKRTQSAHHLSRGKSSKAGGRLETIIVSVISENEAVLREIVKPDGAAVHEGEFLAFLTAENYAYQPGRPLDRYTARKFRTAVLKEISGESE